MQFLMMLKFTAAAFKVSSMVKIPNFSKFWIFIWLDRAHRELSNGLDNARAGCNAGLSSWDKWLPTSHLSEDARIARWLQNKATQNCDIGRKILDWASKVSPITWCNVDSPEIKWCDSCQPNYTWHTCSNSSTARAEGECGTLLKMQNFTQAYTVPSWLPEFTYVNLFVGKKAVYWCPKHWILHFLVMCWRSIVY